MLPKLVEGKGADTPVRVWVPGCASGEEAYSIAILLIELFAQNDRSPNIQILATDIDEDALEVARWGIYPEIIAADIPPDRLKRFFTHVDYHYHVNKQIRESVVLASQNLVSDAPFSKVDLVNYLEFPSGELTKDLLAMARQGLRTKIRAACHKSIRENQPVADADRHWTRTPATAASKPSNSNSAHFLLRSANANGQCYSGWPTD